jgi:hypothetical protein
MSTDDPEVHAASIISVIIALMMGTARTSETGVGLKF